MWRHSTNETNLFCSRSLPSICDVSHYRFMDIARVMLGKKQIQLVSAGSEILMSDAVRLISMTPDHLKNISQPQHQLSTNFTETVTADGGNYAFTGKKWEGPSSSGHSQAASVIFLHGFLGHSADWDPITAALSLERDCFALNLPGHGSSYFQSASAVENGSSAHHSGKDCPSSLLNFPEAICPKSK